MSRARNRERTWEATRATARLLGELVSARRGESLWLREYPAAGPAAVDGDIGRVVLGVGHRGVHRSCAVVSDLGATISISVETQPQGVSVLRSFRGNEPGLREAADAMVAALEASFGPSQPGAGLVIENDQRREHGDPHEPGDRDEPVKAAALQVPPVDDDERAFRRNLRLLGAASTKDQRPGLLDAGYAVLDGLGQLLAVPEARWRLELWGNDQKQSGASISLAGGPHQWEHLVTITAKQSGATITVPGAVMGAEDNVLCATTIASLAGLLGNVGALVRQAVDGRAGFRGRSLSALAIAHELAAALRSAGVAHAAGIGGDDTGFPRRWPRAQVVEKGAPRDYPLAELEEGFAPHSSPEADAPSGPFVSLSIDDHNARLFDETDLAPLLPELVARAAARAARITPERLTLEQIYEVLEPFSGLPRGAKLRYSACHSDPRGEQYEYRFTLLGAGGSGGLISLVDYRDDQILRELHRYLARSIG